MLWILCCLTQILAYGVKASECTLSSVEDIYVYGNDIYKSFIPVGATFEFFVYDSTTRANVYFCEECVGLTNWGFTVSSAYLYVYIHSNTSNYYWTIGSDYHSDLAWGICYGGNINALGSNYNLDINSCLNVAKWSTYNGTEWNNDFNMRLSIRNPICYETDIYPQTNSKTTQTVAYKVDTSTTWNGDLYFEFSIYEEGCMNPQLSFSIKTYENIQIYDDIDTLIATCNGQSCGTFDPCLIEYYIDDIIQINETYSIMIHQTADINNLSLCDDYILEAILTLTCIPDNIFHIPTSTVGGKSSRVTIIATATSIGITIVAIILYCMYKKMKTKIIVMAQDKADKDEQKIFMVHTIHSAETKQ